MSLFDSNGRYVEFDLIWYCGKWHTWAEIDYGKRYQRVFYAQLDRDE